MKNYHSLLYYRNLYQEFNLQFTISIPNIDKIKEIIEFYFVMTKSYVLYFKNILYLGNLKLIMYQKSYAYFLQIRQN